MAELRIPGRIRKAVGLDCIEKMVEGIIQENSGHFSHHTKNIICYAHNGSGFDSWLVLQESGLKFSKILQTSLGILSLKLKPFRFNARKIKGKIVSPQINIEFRCSMRHIGGSLKNLCKDFCIPAHLSKQECDIGRLSADNWNDPEWLEKWSTYMQYDVVALDQVLYIHNQQMEEITGAPIHKFITSSAHAYKTLLSKSPQIYSLTDYNVNQIVKRASHGGRVWSCIKEFNPLNIKSMEDVQKLDTRTLDIGDNYLIACDANSLYPSAMHREDFRYPKIESVNIISRKQSAIIMEQLNSGTFK
jgi:hypothetical protein